MSQKIWFQVISSKDVFSSHIFNKTIHFLLFGLANQFLIFGIDI